MSYQETVRKKIEASTARQQERSELWADITEAYEEGGARDVESVLTKRMEDVAVEFRHVLEKLERML